MDVAITGSHGLIGTALSRSLRADGHRVVALARPGSHEPGTIPWDPDRGTIEAAGLVGVDAVVHLAGEGIASGRFTEAHKAKVRDSRVRGTTLLAETLAGLDGGPRVLISGSAIGYYGDRGDAELTEASPAGTDFLARVCETWEAATSAAEDAGIRVVHIRTGIVLSPDGGILGKTLLPTKLGLSGRAGDGNQWLSWITLTDEVRAIRFLLEHDVSGACNLTAPNPVTNADYTKALGHVLHRPTVLRIPKLVAKLPLGIGELAETLLFSGAKVHPAALQEAGFTFSDPDLEPALHALLGR